MDTALLARRRATSLFSSFLHFDISFMVWVLLGPLALFIAGDLHLTTVQKAILVAVPPLGGAFFRVILGILSDAFGPKRVGVISMTLTLVPLAIGYLAGTSFAQMLVVGALLGLAGASFAVSLPLASRWFPPERQGIAMGIAGAGNSGTVITALFAPRLAAHFGWHATLGLAMIPVALAAIAFAFLAFDSPEQPPAKKLSEYLDVLKQRDTWWFCFFYSITFGGFVGILAYLGIFFHDQYSVDKVAVGSIVAFAALMGSGLRPVGGYISDKVGGITVLRVVYVVVAAMAFVIATLPSQLVCEIAVFVLLGALGTGNGAVFQIVPQRFRKEIGVVTGIVGAAGGVGGFYLPTMLGVLKQTSGTFASGWMTFGIIALVATGILTFVGRVWTTTFMLRDAAPRTAYAFALEEG